MNQTYHHLVSLPNQILNRSYSFLQDYDSGSPTEQSRQFRRELLSLIRRELFETAERETGDIQEGVLRQVAGIVQRCQDQYVQSSRQVAEVPLCSSQHPEQVATNESLARENSIAMHTSKAALGQNPNTTALTTTPESPVQTISLTPGNFAAPLSDATEFASLDNLPWIDWDNVFDDFPREYSLIATSETPWRGALENNPDVAT
jgi:hypothetical protein